MSEIPGPQQPKEAVQERDLCILYGDHDECPYSEVDTDGTVTLCLCSCHLDPDSRP
jgi:hypothetical protein